MENGLIKSLRETFLSSRKLPLSPACTKFIQIILVPKENEQEFFLCSS